MQRFEPTSRMSQAVVHNGFVFLAGQVDKSQASNVAEQTLNILARIDALLALAGSDKAHIVLANIWLADINDFGGMNAVWDKWVEAGAPPARATVEARLADPAYKVEIAVIAAQRL